MKIAGVMMVRDAAALIPVNLAHHRALGVDEFWITDNGSTDGTPDVLEAERIKHRDVHWTSSPGPFAQAMAMTALASLATGGGADWVVPIDADEFWWAPRSGFRRTLEREHHAGGFRCDVDNFVQRRSVLEEDRRSLLTMTYRARPIGTIESARDLVECGEIGFVEIVYPPKVILRASPDLAIGTGSHSATGTAGPVVDGGGLRVLHAPLRSRADLMRRSEHGVRAAAVAAGPNTSWHVRRWARLAETGDLADDWRANSHRRGRLRVGGVHRKLVRDLRLRDAVRPFL